jgi:chromosome segregation ATPase
MQVKYENDLESLYEAFTGKTSKPGEIKSFSDINIAALSSRFSECGPKRKPDRSSEILQQEQLQQQQRQQQQEQQEEQRRRQEQYPYQQREQNPMARIIEENNRELERIKLRAEIKEKSIREEGANMSGVMATNTSTNLRVKKTESSFSNYAAHIRTMTGNADKFKARLLEIVDKLFLVVKNDATSNQAKITIHPALSNEMLNQLVNQTRDIIVQLYLGCERDFYTGIKLLRVIIEEKMQETMEAALANLKAETVKQVKVLSQRNKENEYAKRQNEVKAIQDAVNLNKNDINVAPDERDDDLKKLTDELTNKKKELEEAKQKSEDFKKELDLITAKIKQYEDEQKLVPVPGDAKLTAKITDLNAKKAATEAEKAAVDSEITTLTSKYNDLKTKYSA